MKEKNLFEIVSQCRNLSHSAENTLFHILIHALPILLHWLGFRLSAPYLNSCITYLNTLSQWVSFRLSAPHLNTCFTYVNILSRLSAAYLNTCIAFLNTLSRLHILIHATPILIHWLGFRLHILIHCRLVSAAPESSANRNRALRHSRALGSQSESSITSPELSANQNWALPHTRELSAPESPFSALSSSRLAIAYLNTWGAQPPHLISSHSYYLKAILGRRQVSTRAIGVWLFSFVLVISQTFGAKTVSIKIHYSLKSQNGL